MNEAVLLILEVSGIQQYVFSTNKRAENAGASQLIDGLSQVFRLAASGTGAEELMVSSGKIIARAADAATARQLISDVTVEMLIKAPGVDVVGAITDPVDLDDDHATAMAVRRLHRRAARLRSARPGPTERFPRLPWVAECATSGLPASGRDHRFGDDQDRSAMSQAKWQAWDDAVGRFARLLSVPEGDVRRWARQLDDNSNAVGDGSGGSGRPLEWVGVIHADGNGIGGLLQRASWLQPEGADLTYHEALGRFSHALRRCAEKALVDAHEVVERCPLLPLVVGGDDLTVLIDGTHALAFADAYLSAFEEITGDDDYLAGVASRASRGVSSWLTACAGVAVVKPHFPFSAAYDLAQDLTDNAKALVRDEWRGDDPASPSPFSAIDFHQLLDSTSSGLHDIRARTTVIDEHGDERSLVRRPYLTTSDEVLTGRLNRADLARTRSWSQLVALAEALGTRGENEVPRSQVVPLRARLYESNVRIVNHQLDQLQTWYPDSALAGMLGGDRALEGTDPADWLLDALDVAEMRSVNR